VGDRRAQLAGIVLRQNFPGLDGAMARIADQRIAVAIGQPARLDFEMQPFRA
jgi:hypothetical protein